MEIIIKKTEEASPPPPNPSPTGEGDKFPLFAASLTEYQQKLNIKK